jgi:farnesyl diphosphate synthase
VRTKPLPGILFADLLLCWGVFVHCYWFGLLLLLLELKINAQQISTRKYIMSTTTLLSTLGIPIAIAAIALSQLSPVLDQVSAAFFEQLSAVQQMSALALLFALIFAAVASSTFATGSRSSSRARFGRRRTQTPNYPVQEIQAASTDADKFKALFPMLKDEILEYLKTENELCNEAVDWVDDMLEYSVPGGKLNRGTTVVAVYRSLLGGRDLTVTETAKAAIAGWTIEFLQAFFLVADDLMDDSQTRRGQPCWYKLPKVGLIAINDSFLLESFVFFILRTHFGNEPYYADLLELMLDVTQKTEVGQLLDLTSQPAGAKTINLNRFTEERYRSIVKYKTAFYSFYLPVAMGMHISGIADESAFQQARKICCIMGEYFQIQDDFLDCFGDPETIGKVGTDIQDNKCSWLVVQALQKCGPAQRAILEQNYGVWDDAKVERVKQLYRDLELIPQFEQYEEDSYQLIQEELKSVTLVPREVFELFLNKIYKRSK